MSVGERHDYAAWFRTEVLTATTSDLQRAGWSQSPATRWRSNPPKEGAVTTTPNPSPETRVRVEARGPRIDTALLALASDTRSAEVLPPLAQAVRRAEHIRAALMHFCPSPCFSGKDKEGHPLQGHAHACIMPLSLRSGASSNESRGQVDESRARIDHVLVHASGGLRVREQQALSRLRRIYVRGLPDIYVTLVGTGTTANFDQLVPGLRLGTRWRSATSFVPPRYLKVRGRNALEGQVREELASRGLPPAASVEVELEGGGYVSTDEFWGLWQQRQPGEVVLAEQEGEAKATADTAAPRASRANRDSGGGEVERTAILTLAHKWRHFVRWRTDVAKGPPMAAGFGLRITFERPARGPIALGYGAHFGLGQFVVVGEGE